MKYLIGVIIVVIGALAYFISSDNKTDAERLKQAEIAQQQKLEQEKKDAINAEKEALIRVSQKESEQAKSAKQGTDESKSETTPTISHVSAESVSKPKDDNKISDEEWLGICKSAAGAAKGIMNARQRGVTMTEMMEKVVGTADPAVKDVARAMVISAYEKPRFDTPEYQQKAEIDFENESYLACIKSKT